MVARHSQVLSGFVKPSPGNLLAAYSSTMSHTASTVNRLQSDSNVRTHVHFSWSQRTTSSHAQSRLQSPKASDKNNFKKNRRASCYPPALRQQADRKTHTHARTHRRKARPCYLFMPQLRMPAGVKTLSLGVFFFFLLDSEAVRVHSSMWREGKGYF